MAVDKFGNLYYSDYSNYVIRKVSTTGIISTIYSGSAQPHAVTTDSLGNIFFGQGTPTHIQKLDLQQNITTIAGVGGSFCSGDGGPAINANLEGVHQLKFDVLGNLYFTNCFGLRKIDAQTNIITLPVATLNNSDIFIIESTNTALHILANQLRRIDLTTGNATVIAGTGTAGTSGDGGLAINAQLDYPAAVCTDIYGNIYIAEQERIRKVDINTGIITTYAGVIGGGSTLEGATALSASVVNAAFMQCDIYGNLYYWNPYKVYKITATPPVIDITTSNFSVLTYDECNGPKFIVTTPAYDPNYTVQTFYGDGTDDINSFAASSGNMGYLPYTHTFPLSGTYPIKHVLYDGTDPIDSISYSYDYSLCRSIAAHLYFDKDNDCTYSPNIDEHMSQTPLIQVDSNGVPVDTLSTGSGFVYNAHGNGNDIYSFTLLSTPFGLQSACQAIVDTLNSPISTGIHDWALQCSGVSGFDLSVNTTLQCAANRSAANIVVNNSYCNGTNSQLTMTFSPKYVFNNATLPPSSQTTNSITWDLDASSFVNNFIHLYVNLSYNMNLLTIGDTVNTKFELTPTTGDINPSNNIIIRNDTVTGPFDPNAIYVNPKGCVQAGDELEYTITFENMGTDTAHHIYVMDTLSVGVNMSSFNLIAASHLINVTKISNAYNILKFEFPNINLPDSSSPYKHGMINYKIKTNNNWPNGATVTNKAGIYFDYMPAVLTNVAETNNCGPLSINTLPLAKDNTLVYPNPATNEIIIKSDKELNSYTITNSLGQTMSSNAVKNQETKINIKQFPTGVYYIILKSKNGSVAKKFVKI